MNNKEVRQLTGRFYEALQKRVEEHCQGSVEFVQLSDTTFIFKIDDGNLGSEPEAYELFNNGEDIKWTYRGKVS